MKRSVYFIITIILLSNSAVVLSCKDNSTKVSGYPGFKTDVSKASIDLSLVFSGGPGKDGIPALMSPSFVTIGSEHVADDILGILIEHKGIKKFYPYNILVWHEIVNDSIKDLHYAVTFCPLCGSAIVFNRTIKGKTVTFGVSGKLYQSNMLMYDSRTESFWSQSKGEAVVGTYTGTKLEYLEMQLISYKNLQENHPDALVLSRRTGYSRNYDFYPYGDYVTNNSIYFPISVTDKRYPLKKMMFIIPLEEVSAALPLDIIGPGEKEIKVKNKTLVIEKKQDEITVYYKGQKIPAYYEMWFSWAIHNQETGIVIDK